MWAPRREQRDELASPHGFTAKADDHKIIYRFAPITDIRDCSIAAFACGENSYRSGCGARATRACSRTPATASAISSRHGAVMILSLIHISEPTRPY